MSSMNKSDDYSDGWRDGRRALIEDQKAARAASHDVIGAPSDDELFAALKSVMPEAKRFPPGFKAFALAVLALRPAAQQSVSAEVVATYPAAKYFVYCSEGGYNEYATDAGRDAGHKAEIQSHLEDSWSEEVTSVVSGIVTHCTVQTDLEHRPPQCSKHEEQDDDCDVCAEYNEWPDHDHDWTCNYVPNALGVITDTPTIKPELNVAAWISCADRKPSIGTHVLVASEFDGPGDWRIKVGGLIRDTGEWYVMGASWTPSYWAELPVPPVTDTPQSKDAS